MLPHQPCPISDFFFALYLLSSFCRVSPVSRRSDYCVMDTVMVGWDGRGMKQQIATAYGFDEFADIALHQIELLKMLLEDLPPDEWELRFDVSSPGFLFTWAAVLDRKMPSLVSLNVETAKRTAMHTEFFSNCAMMAMAILFVKPDGGFTDNNSKGEFVLCIVGLLVMMRVVGRDGRNVRYVERVLELPYQCESRLLTPAHALPPNPCRFTSLLFAHREGATKGTWNGLPLVWRHGVPRATRFRSTRHRST